MLKQHLAINLQRFNDEGEEHQQQQAPSNQDQNNQIEPPKNDGGGNEQKPFATFPDEASFHSRLQRETEKQFGSLLESLGIESKEQLTTIVEDRKRQEQEALTESERLQQQLEQYKQQSEKATELANRTVVNSEARLTAINLGVEPKRINHFLKVVDLNEVKVVDGVADQEKLKELLSATLEEIPEFAKKPTAPPQGAGDHFNGGSNGNAPLTLAQIKNMSKEEIAERIDEVRQVMGGK